MTGAIALAVLCVGACSGSAGTDAEPDESSAGPPVQVVVFTHIEDNSPGGVLGSEVSRNSYLALRGSLLQMGALAARYRMRWSLEPDWKFLLAALQYETPDVRASTAGLNLLRFLRDSVGVAIDPHSHEGGGYNYTDVAHLLDSLGVGGSTVIGGHIWDPALPQFSAWDRFRIPVKGSQYPSATWRGDLLMGSGTPNHVNDPIVSGMWRPRSRDRYFEDDPAGNIGAVGAYTGDLAGVAELVSLYRARTAPATCILTASMPVSPSEITPPGGLASIESTIVKPLAQLRDRGDIALTDFTSLSATWKRDFGERVCMYRLGALTH